MNKQILGALTSLLSGLLGAVLVFWIGFEIIKANPEILISERGKTATSTPESIVKNFFSKETYAEESLVISAVKASKPAVVSVVITKDVPVIEQYYAPGAPNNIDPFFNQFFGDSSPFNFQIPQYRQNGTKKQEVGGGSGFLVTADGLIITNRHVVADTSAQYTVLLNDGTKHDAKVIARDSVNDIAVIKIVGTNLPHLNFDNSDDINVGQTAIAIGNALGEFRNTVSVGVVSGLARSVTAGDSSGSSEQLENVIQTDAAINPGNSGGPLLNLDGKVIGVNVAVAMGSQNIGFSIPSNVVKSIVDSVVSTGKIVRPYLGIRYAPITPAIKEKNKLPMDNGVIVLRGSGDGELAVVPGSPADKAGIVENDVIVSMSGVTLDDTHGLASLIRNKKVGDTVSLKVWSKGVYKTVKVKLEAAKE